MTREQEEAVRRALASAPPVGPMPADVVARLEATVGDLVAERAQAGPVEAGEDHPGGNDPTADDATAEGPVVPIEAARRRRRWTGVLVAATVLAVVGAGIGTVVRGGAGEESASTSAGSAADTGGEESGEGAGGARDDALVALTARPVALRSASLAADAGAVLDSGAVVPLSAVERLTAAGETERRGTARTRSRTAQQLAACDLPDVARGDLVAPAALDGVRATLVVRRTVAGTGEAQVYSCADGGRLLASASLPRG